MKHIFLHGLGYKKDYRHLEKYFKLPTINWTTWQTKIPKGTDTLIGFSLGALVACEYAMQHKVKNLILCSMTPGAESLKDVKADNITFIVGENEEWVATDLCRIMETNPNVKGVVIVPKGKHKLDRTYIKWINKVVERL